MQPVSVGLVTATLGQLIVFPRVFLFQVYLTVLKHGDSATLDTMLRVKLTQSAWSPLSLAGSLIYTFCPCLSAPHSSTSKQTCRRRRTVSSESLAPSQLLTLSRKFSASPSRYKRHCVSQAGFYLSAVTQKMKRKWGFLNKWADECVSVFWVPVFKSFHFI